jgi:hypothetical protein
MRKPQARVVVLSWFGQWIFRKKLTNNNNSFSSSMTREPMDMGKVAVHSLVVTHEIPCRRRVLRYTTVLQDFSYTFH